MDWSSANVFSVSNQPEFDSRSHHFKGLQVVVIGFGSLRHGFEVCVAEQICDESSFDYASFLSVPKDVMSRQLRKHNATCICREYCDLWDYVKSHFFNQT